MTMSENCHYGIDGDKLICDKCKLTQFPWYHNFCQYCGGKLIIEGRWVGELR